MVTEVIQNITLYKKLKTFYSKYERWAIPAFLIFGFIVDVITFKNLDIIIAFVLLGIHVCIAGVAIAYINIYDARWYHTSPKIRGFLRLIAPFAMQFSFGALLSAAFIFYSFSGSLFVSWPLIAVILFLMVANELFQKYYLKPNIQITVYFFLVFALFSLIFPFVFHSISPWFFVLAGVSAVLFMYIYIYIVSKIHYPFKKKKTIFFINIFIVFISMHLLYIFNRIPPVPMSLSEVGVYHNIEHQGSNYIISQEKESLIDKITPGKKFHTLKDQQIFVYASIFAPSKLNTTIVHNWQKFDDQTKTWKSESKLSYNISGGRKEGYRGFSVRGNVSPGRWRVLVETGRGQVMGKINFEVINVDYAIDHEIVQK